MAANRTFTIDESGSDDESFHPVTRIVDGDGLDGINLNELSEGITFLTVPEDKEPSLKEATVSYFESEEFKKHVCFKCLDADSDDEEDGEYVPGDTPFTKIAAKMQDVLSDGSIKKMVSQKGEENGEKVPEGALVTLQYNIYQEYIVEPFDSTYMRTGPEKWRLSNGSLLPGVELAVRSMRRNERSWFLVQPHMAFGNLGCEPRILPNATLLLDIHLLDYIDSGGAVSFESLTPEEQSYANFSDVLSAAKGHHLQGNDLFKDGDYFQTAIRYRRAVHILENCTTVKDEKDEAEQNNLLVKLYVNLGVTYNFINDPQKVFIFTKKALSLDPNNAKAFYNQGKAYVTLNDFQNARSCLIKARSFQPNCREINSELKRLEEKQKKYVPLEKQMYARMIGSASKNHPQKNKEKQMSTQLELTDTLRETVETDLKQFLQDDRKEPMTFPQGLTAAEIDFMRSTAEKYGLRVCTSHNGKLSVLKE